MSFTTEDLREIYESVPHDYIEVLKQTVLTGRFGCTIGDLFKITENPFTLGELTLAKDVQKMFEQLLGQNEQIMNRLNRIESRLDKVEERLDKIEVRLARIDNEQVTETKTLFYKVKRLETVFELRVIETADKILSEKGIG